MSVKTPSATVRMYGAWPEGRTTTTGALVRPSCVITAPPPSMYFTIEATVLVPELLVLTLRHLTLSMCSCRVPPWAIRTWVTWTVVVVWVVVMV